MKTKMPMVEVEKFDELTIELFNNFIVNHVKNVIDCVGLSFLVSNPDVMKIGKWIFTEE